MKFNHPQTHETIFFILEPNNGPDVPVHVAFDDADTAKAYLNRFRTYGDAQIVECYLNPGFYTDITRDCYFIQLGRHTEVYVISLVSDWQQSQLAINEYYFFEGDQICIYLMATSEAEALLFAREIKARPNQAPFCEGCLQHN